MAKETDKLVTVIEVDASGAVKIRQVAKEVNKLEKTTTGATQKMSLAWVNLGAKVFIAEKAIRSMKKAYDFTKEGAQILQLESAFKRLGGTQIVIQELSDAVRGTVDEATLIRFSNMASALGINQKQFAGLAKVSRAAADILGIDVSFAIESVTTGTARQSKLWLDNLGIIISMEEAQRNYAGILNKTVKELDDYEKQQAFINAVIEKGNVLIGKAGQEGSAVDSFDKFESSGKNLADTVKKKIAPALNDILDILTHTNEQWIALLKNTKIKVEAVTVDITDPGILKRNAEFDAKLRAEAEAKALAKARKAWQESLSLDTQLAGFLAITNQETDVLIKLQQERIDKQKQLDEWANEDKLQFIIQSIEAEKSLEQQRTEGLLTLQQERIEGQINANNLLKDSYSDLYGGITNALMAFKGTQKVGFILQRAGAAATAYVHGMAAATAAMAPPPVGLGPIAGVGLAAKIKALTYANVAAILATSFASPPKGAVSGGAGASGTLPVGGAETRPRVTVILQGGMENMLERINEFVEDSDFELIATEAKHAISADTLR